MFVLIVLAIVYGPAENGSAPAISTSVSTTDGFRTQEACVAAAERLNKAPRPGNLEIRATCEPAG